MRVGRYRVLGRLAAGESSDALLARAEDASGPERLVVLKLVLRQLREDPNLETTLAQETSVYARLSHPAIVKLYELFVDAGRLMMAFEHVDGAPLSEFLSALERRGRRLSDSAVIFVAWRVLSALSAAHGAKDPGGAPSPVIHRNVNPSTILIPLDGEVKLADFGIAKFSGLYGTQVMNTKGTSGYLPPEHVKGQAATARGDVYAACLVLWELLAGRRAIAPVSGAHWDMIRAMAEPNFPPLASLRSDLPKALVQSIARGLEPTPERRDIEASKLCEVLRSSVDLEEGRQELVEVLTAMRQPPPSTTTPPPPSPAAVVLPAPVVPSSPPTVAAPPGGASPIALPASKSAGPARRSRLPIWAVVFFGLLQLAALAGIALFIKDRLRGALRSPPGSRSATATATETAIPTPSLTATASPTSNESTTPPPALSRSPSLMASASPSPSEPAKPMPSQRDTATPPTALPPSSPTGTITVGGDYATHRVWIDGHLVGDAPQSFTVHCGVHSVRIGSDGAERRVSVPCGGSVDMR